MGWKSKRNREIKSYATIFVVCVVISGAIAIITGKTPAFVRDTIDKQIERRANKILGSKLKDFEGMEDIDSRKIEEIKRKYNGMAKY